MLDGMTSPNLDGYIHVGKVISSASKCWKVSVRILLFRKSARWKIYGKICGSLSPCSVEHCWRSLLSKSAAQLGVDGRCSLLVPSRHPWKTGTRKGHYSRHGQSPCGTCGVGRWETPDENKKDPCKQLPTALRPSWSAWLPIPRVWNYEQRKVPVPNTTEYKSTSPTKKNRTQHE